MTTPTTATTPVPKITALAKIKALKDQMEAFKTEAIEELNVQIVEKEQELAALRGQLAELTGVSLEAGPLTPRRKRGPNKARDEASTGGAEGEGSAQTDGKVE